MSRFEYFLSFETILYGLVLAHAVIGFSQMIYHRKTIDFYWGHILVCITIFLVVIQTYYSLFWVPAETVTSPWTFFFLRIAPLTLLYIVTYQVFPEKVKNLKSETFLFSRIKEMLVPMIIYNLLSVAKTIYYRWDEYLELGNGNVMNSSKFIMFVSPPVILATLAFLMIFKYNKKRLIEAFIVFTFIMSLVYMTFGANKG